MSKKILPLSHNPRLKKQEVSGLNVYYDYLRTSFRDRRIKNIAITGPRGIGKSSILRSFESSRPPFFAFNPRFLYVSIGNYDLPENPNSDTEKNSPVLAGVQESISTDRNQNRENGNQNKVDDGIKSSDSKDKKGQAETNSIERRLLLQIYSRFRQKDLPSSGYKLIPDHFKWRFVCSLLFAAFILSVLLLTFKESLGQLIVSTPFTQPCLLLACNFIISHRQVIQLMLYGFCFGSTVFFMGLFAYQIIPYMKMLKLSLTSNHLQFDMERETCADYLDQYTMELIYCLEQIGGKIGRTVVFEDMDRLNPDVCIAIFTRLREINHMINLRLPEHKYIRFVFVTNDDITNRLVTTKFFDYILPIMPSLNVKSAELVFMQNLKAVDKSIRGTLTKEHWMTYALMYVKKQIGGLLLKAPIVRRNFATQLQVWTEYPNDLVSSLFSKVESKANSGIVHMVAASVHDYREQFAILNDYGLLVKLYAKNNPSKLTSYDIEKILAFAIYKFLCPKDFKQAIVGGSSIFTGKSVKCVANGNHTELLYWLKSSGKLSIRSLHYAGFSEEKVADRLGQILRQCAKDDVVEAIRSLNAEDSQCIDILTDYCAEYRGTIDERFLNILANAAECVLRCGYQNKHPEKWFFLGRNVRDCVDALLLLEDDCCKRFLQSFEWSSPDNVYADCGDWNNIQRYEKYWTEKRLLVLHYGLKNFTRRFDITIWDENLSEVLREATMQDELKKFNDT